MVIGIIIIPVQQQQQSHYIFVLVQRVQGRLEDVINHGLVEAAFGQRFQIQ
ncbi:hypothetical protein D3C81_2302140 [compost metagenome]